MKSSSSQHLFSSETAATLLAFESENQDAQVEVIAIKIENELLNT